MILIADSSALITLAIVDKLCVLDKLFKDVYIPRAVYNEIVQENKEESIKLKAYRKAHSKNVVVLQNLKKYLHQNIKLKVAYQPNNTRLKLCLR